jgi:hypothetical protein
MAALVDAFAMAAIWTTWKNEIRAGGNKPSKVPYALDGGLAKSNDPSTWMTYFEAEQCRDQRHHDGINIMLAPVEDGLHLGGIDLDACIGEEGDLEPWAAEIVVKVNSYTEVSPSGTGLKIFFLHDPKLTLDAKHRWRKHVQKPNPKGGKDLGIEQYLAKHFMAVTEAVYQGYTTLRTIGVDILYAVRTAMARFDDKPAAPRMDDTDRLYDAIAAMRNGDLSWEEWNTRGMAIHKATGGSTRGYEAFMAWSAQSSKFDERACRERWDNWRVSPGDQVGEGTIFHHALDAGWVDPNKGKPNGHHRPNGNGHDYEPYANDDDYNIGVIGKRKKAVFRIGEGDVIQWDGVDVPEVDMLIDNMLPLHVAGILAGDGGAGKSLLSQVLCTSVATGFAFCGRRVDRGKAVYITGEDPETVLHNRQARINESLGYNMKQLGGRLFLRSILDDDIFLFVDGRPSGLHEELATELEVIGGIKLLIIDSAAIVFDDDEIKRRPVAKFMILLNRLARRLKATVLLITHKSRSGGSGAGTFTSGSTGWAAHARCGFDITPATEDDDTSDVILKLTKPNYTKPLDPIALRWNRHGVLEWVPNKPLTQLELTTQRSAEKADDVALMRAIDSRWKLKSPLMKNVDPKLTEFMARNPYKWPVKKTVGVANRLQLLGWIIYNDAGRGRGWKVTDEGLSEMM